MMKYEHFTKKGKFGHQPLQNGWGQAILGNSEQQEAEQEDNKNVCIKMYIVHQLRLELTTSDTKEHLLSD